MQFVSLDPYINADVGSKSINAHTSQLYLYELMATHDLSVNDSDDGSQEYKISL